MGSFHRHRFYHGFVSLIPWQLLNLWQFGCPNLHHLSLDCVYSVGDCLSLWMSCKPFHILRMKNWTIPILPWLILQNQNQILHPQSLRRNEKRNQSNQSSSLLFIKPNEKHRLSKWSRDTISLNLDIAMRLELECRFPEHYIFTDLLGWKEPCQVSNSNQSLFNNFINALKLIFRWNYDYILVEPVQ